MVIRDLTTLAMKESHWPAITRTHSLYQHVLLKQYAGNLQSKPRDRYEVSTKANIAAVLGNDWSMVPVLSQSRNP